VAVSSSSILRRHAATVVVVDLQAEGAGAPRHRLADPSHADDAEALAPDAVAEHPGWRPAIHGLSSLSTAAPSARRRGTLRMRAMVMSAVSSVRTPGRVGHGDAAAERGRDVDMVDTVAVVGNQLELVAGLAQHGGVDAVGDGGHQDVGILHGFRQFGLGHGLIVEIEPRVEEFAHAGLDSVRKLACDDDQGLLAVRHGSTSSARPAKGCAPPFRSP
jgi:hypothetical protein